MSTILPPQHPAQAVPTSPPELSPDQQASLANLIEHFSSPSFKLPVPSASVDQGMTPATYTESLGELECFWLSEEQILRFLRATKWNEQDAKTRLEKTLIWRREFAIEGLNKEYLSPENETGKQICFGFDNQARPIWYMRPALQNTDTLDRQLQHVFYMMTLAECMMPRGVEKIALFINFAARGSSPPMSQSKKVLYILQDHYPERLGTAYVVNLPWIARGFFKIITPLLDPVTRAKLSLPGSPDLSTIAPPSQLEKSFGGAVDWGTYGPQEHAEYWLGERGIVVLAEERRRRGLEKWRTLGGGMVGRREWDWKEGEETWGV